MKTFFHSLLLSLMVGASLAGPAAAQTNLAGKWQGKLEVAPGQTMTIHFVIAAKPGGGYTAVVTSPDDGAIKNVSAKSVQYADSRLTIDVPALSGGYAGTLRDGVLEGEWSQEGAKLPLSLRLYEKLTLTRADIDVLRGEWVGTLSGPGGTVTIVLRFKTRADGALQAGFDVPEQGVKDWEAKDVALDDGDFSVELPRARTKVTGKLKGDQIVGQWTQLGNSTPLTLKKGPYVVVASYLDLPAEAREQLKGRWSGTLNNLPVIVSFETDVQGRTQGFFHSTQQGMKISITEAKLAGRTLTLRVSYGATYKAELAGDTLKGEWTQAGFANPLPLVLTREKYAAPVAQELTADAAAPYLGLYWFEPEQRPIFVVLHENRLALELPWRVLRELNKTADEHVWSYAENPNNLVTFRRDGAGPATAMELRQDQTTTLARFEPEKGLPSLDELFQRRPDTQRAERLAALGIIRMSGSARFTASQETGSFELLAAGNDDSRLKVNVNGREVRQAVTGNRAWVQYQASMPVEEMPEALAKAVRRNGWLLATGDWRGAFAQARVLKRVDLDGKPVFIVHAAPKQGWQRLIYLDVDTGLLRGYDEVQDIPGMGPAGCQVRVADYRDIEGVQIPFKITVKYRSPQLGTQTYQVEKIETGLKLDKDAFTIK